MQRFLVFGKSGWIGGLLGELLASQGANYVYADARLEDRAGVLADIERVCMPCRLWVSCLQTCSGATPLPCVSCSKFHAVILDRSKAASLMLM